MRRRPSRRVLLVAGLVAALALAFGPQAWSLVRERGSRPGGPTWREPATIAVWARDRFAAASLHPATVDARIERRTPAPRRLILTTHPMTESFATAVHAAAKVLLAARDGGEATSTHAAILRQGTRAVILGIGDASRVAESEAAAAAWLEAQEHPPRFAESAEGQEANDHDAPPDGEATDLALLGPVPPPLAAVPVDATLDASLAPPPGGAPLPAGDVGPASALPRAMASGASGSSGASGASGPSGATAPPVRVQRGMSGPPLPSRIAPGAEGVILLRAQINGGNQRILRLDSLTVRVRGTLNDAEDVRTVELARDVDRDGKRGPNDQTIGSGQTFEEDNGTVTFAGLDHSFGEAGMPLDLLVSVDLSDDSRGGTVSLTLADQSSVSVFDTAAGSSCSVRGVPIMGPVVIVEANRAAIAREEVDEPPPPEPTPEEEDVAAEMERLEEAAADLPPGEGTLQQGGAPPQPTGPTAPVGVPGLKPGIRSRR